MELKQTKSINLEQGCTLKSTDDEIISTDECKQYLNKFQLDDERIVIIKNNLIGIVDNLINNYLEEYK